MAIEETLSAIQQDISEIKVVLKGYNGDPGLCKEVEHLKRKFYNFRLLISLFIAFLFGAAGFTITEILKLVK